MTKKRLQKIYNCVKMHYNMLDVRYAQKHEDSGVLRLLKNERKTMYRDFEEWYQRRRVELFTGRILTNIEIYDTYLIGPHCLYFHGDHSRIFSGDVKSAVH